MGKLVHSKACQRRGLKLIQDKRGNFFIAEEVYISIFKPFAKKSDREFDLMAKILQGYFPITWESICKILRGYPKIELFTGVKCYKFAFFIHFGDNKA